MVLGIYGMLGHKLVKTLASQHEVWGTCRNLKAFDIMPKDRIIQNVNVDDFQSVIDAIDKINPDVVINCIGLIKQLKGADELLTSLEINSMFPQKLAVACNARNIRMIHFSTDCVFSGNKGMYKQSDIPDAVDAYGKTKFLGEIKGDNCLTIRSSIIGRELGTKNGLLEWFISNRGKTVQGYQNAIYSGFTTKEMGNIVNMIIMNHPDLSGVWQVASQSISKFELLNLINTKFNLDIEIEPFDDFYCDRSLDGSEFSMKTGYKPPSWENMVEAISQDEQNNVDVKT